MDRQETDPIAEFVGRYCAFRAAVYTASSIIDAAAYPDDEPGRRHPVPEALGQLAREARRLAEAMPGLLGLLDEVNDLLEIAGEVVEASWRVAEDAFDRHRRLGSPATEEDRAAGEHAVEMHRAAGDAATALNVVAGAWSGLDPADELA